MTLEYGRASDWGFKQLEGVLMRHAVFMQFWAGAQVLKSVGCQKQKPPSKVSGAVGWLHDTARGVIFEYIPNSVFLFASFNRSIVSSSLLIPCQSGQPLEQRWRGPWFSCTWKKNCDVTMLQPSLSELQRGVSFCIRGHQLSLTQLWVTNRNAWSAEVEIFGPFDLLRGSVGALVSCELQRCSVDVGFMPPLLILELEMPLPFAPISFVPTTSLSCLEKSGRQRCVCAHEKTRTKSMSCIGTTALQLFFCTVDGYMQLDDNTGIACSNMDASICFGGWRYWIWNMRSIWLCRGLCPCLWKPATKFLQNLQVTEKHSADVDNCQRIYFNFSYFCQQAWDMQWKDQRLVSKSPTFEHRLLWYS